MNDDNKELKTRIRQAFSIFDRDRNACDVREVFAGRQSIFCFNKTQQTLS
jgi:hypothetical protein